jgi:hypothetical protein
MPPENQIQTTQGVFAKHIFNLKTVILLATNVKVLKRTEDAINRQLGLW